MLDKEIFLYEDEITLNFFIFKIFLGKVNIFIDLEMIEN